MVSNHCVQTGFISADSSHLAVPTLVFRINQQRYQVSLLMMKSPFLKSLFSIVGRRWDQKPTRRPSLASRGAFWSAAALRRFWPRGCRKAPQNWRTPKPVESKRRLGLRLRLSVLALNPNNPCSRRIRNRKTHRLVNGLPGAVDFSAKPTRRSDANNLGQAKPQP
jgi:hypothetical protein